MRGRPIPRVRQSQDRRAHRRQATLSNGHPCDVDDCFIFELRDGLIARVREYMDTLKGARMVFGSLDRVPAA
jgi:ketosteroid isomerase-like protein